MLRDAVSGAVAGLIVGLILGFAIQIITSLLFHFPSTFQEGLATTTMFEGGPATMAPFMGMGVGTLVGAILGGLAGLKSEKIS